jgi:hypothetical protein
MSEALRRLGLRAAGGNHASLQRFVEANGISTDHFDRYWANRVGRAGFRAKPLAEVLVVGSTFHRGHLKERLFKEGVKARECELCGQGENWRGAHMALILDHINGVGDDHRLENLRIVCPNCAATLDTHCGRKNLIPAEPRTCAHCGNKFRPRSRTQRYCCQGCGSRHTNRRRGPRPERRKVRRPDCDQLFAEVDANGYLATGRKYGVSDKAVRKWVRQYEFELWEWSNSLPAEGPWDV